MQLFCPACNAAYFSETRCPRCGGLLLMPHEVSPDAPKQLEAPPPYVYPTAIGRITFGTVLALGLYLGVRKLLIGGVLAASQWSAGGWWLSFQGLTAVYAIQVIAILFGAVIAGAGRPYGYSLGFIVGGVCGGLFLGFELLAGAPPQSLVLYLQPPVLALVGLIAGAVGSRIWLPAPVLNIPLPSASKLSSLQLGDDLGQEMPRPTWWVRILAGSAIMVIGVAAADPVRTTLQKNSAGLLHVESQAQGQFITWQLATIVVLCGGVFAAAGTGAGIRHGVFAGILGAMGVIGACQSRGEVLRPIDYWLARLTLDDVPFMSAPALTAVCGGIIMLAILGGWLGGSLFLPLAPPHMRKRLEVGLD